MMENLGVIIAIWLRELIFQNSRFYLHIVKGLAYTGIDIFLSVDELAIYWNVLDFCNLGVLEKKVYWKICLNVLEFCLEVVVATLLEQTHCIHAHCLHTIKSE